MAAFAVGAQLATASFIIHYFWLARGKMFSRFVRVADGPPEARNSAIWPYTTKWIPLKALLALAGRVGDYFLGERSGTCRSQRSRLLRPERGVRRGGLMPIHQSIFS